MPTTSPSAEQTARTIADVDFTVAFRHRLRFTHDVLGADSEVLVRLLESSEGRIPRVQFWLDEHVGNANPDLRQRLHSIARRNTDKFQVVGNVQIIPGGEAVKNDVHILERMLKVFHEADLDRQVTSSLLGAAQFWMR